MEGELCEVGEGSVSGEGVVFCCVEEELFEVQSLGFELGRFTGRYFVVDEVHFLHDKIF